IIFFLPTTFRFHGFSFCDAGPSKRVPIRFSVRGFVRGCYGVSVPSIMASEIPGIRRERRYAQVLAIHIDASKKRSKTREKLRYGVSKRRHDGIDRRQ